MKQALSPDEQDVVGQINRLLHKSLPGSQSAVKTHQRCGARIALAIWTRFAVKPHKWQCKHVRWYLVECTRSLSATTRYDHWRTLRALLSAKGKLQHWGRHLHGSWMRKDNQECQVAATGRPAKLPGKSIHSYLTL